MGEHADAVAAHLGLRTVGVPVVHEPFGARRDGRGALVDRSGTDDAQNAVCSDAEASVAQGGDLIVRQRQRPIRIRDEHEVVAGAVTFGERDGAGHADKSMGPRDHGWESAIKRFPVVSTPNRSYPSAS